MFKYVVGPRWPTHKMKEMAARYIVGSSTQAMSVDVKEGQVISRLSGEPLIILTESGGV